MKTETACGHFGEHRVLEVYPDNRGIGTVLVAELDSHSSEILHGTIHTVKVQCLTCKRISLTPMTFPE